MEPGQNSRTSQTPLLNPGTIREIFGADAGARASHLTESLENPLPHLREAKDALFKVAGLQKDIWLLDAELKASQQLRRALFTGLAFISLAVCSMLSLFWLGMALHEHGWSSGSLCAGSFLLFGGITAFFVWLALKSRELPGGEREHP